MLGGGCAPPPNIDPSFSTSKIIDVPFVSQKEYQCGSAAVEMLFSHLGYPYPSTKIEKEVFSPDSRGSLQSALVAIGRRNGFVSHEITGFEELLSELFAGRPVIVLQNLALKFWPKWHYAVVVGFDSKDKSFILHSGTNEYLKVSGNSFQATWQRAGGWGLTYLRPGELPSMASPAKWVGELIAYERINPEQVLQAYIGSVKRWPDNVFLLTAYANRLYKDGRLPEAEKLYRDVGLIDGTYVPALNNLADLLLHSKRLDEALGIARKASSIVGPYREAACLTLKEIGHALSVDDML